ncbi:MAG: DinB family protein [Candidatus Zixiibacteriota bacterium]
MLWINRKFEFSLPVEMFPNVLERLRGTPARLEEKLAGLPPDILTRKPGDKWSVQEQVGHLLDLEPLWHGRLADYRNGLKVLRPADIRNRPTTEANHNANSIGNILNAFRAERAKLVAEFEAFGIEGAGQSALYPRLNQPMRVIDGAFFVAEHDDHHLAKISALIRGDYLL